MGIPNELLNYIESDDNDAFNQFKEYFQKDNYEKIHHVLLTDEKGDSLLMYAIRNRKPRIVNFLLEEGGDQIFQHLMESFANEALCYAVVEDDIELKKKLVQNGASVNEALRYAVLEDDMELTKKLVQNGASANEALRYAVVAGDIELTKKLVQNGASFNKASDMVHLLKSIDFDRDLRKFLVNNVKTKNGETFLDEAIVSKDMQSIQELCIEGSTCNIGKYKGAIDNLGAGIANGFRDESGKTRLHFAVIDNDSYRIEKLLSHELYHYVTNVQDEDGKTPLHYIQKPNTIKEDGTDYNIASILVQKNAKVDLQDKSGNTPIYYALSNLDFDFVRALFEPTQRQQELEQRSIKEKNDQSLFTKYRKPDKEKAKHNVAKTIAETILKVKNKEGNTPLHHLVSINRITDEEIYSDLLTYLLSKAEFAGIILDTEYGINSQNKKGEKAIDIANSKDYLSSERVLLEFGSKPAPKAGVIISGACCLPVVSKENQK